MKKISASRMMAVAAVLVFLFTACSKKNEKAQGTAALTMFNGVSGSARLVTTFNRVEPVKWYWSAFRLVYGETRNTDDNYAYNHFLAYSGPQHIELFEYPDTTSHDRPVFDLRLDLAVGATYSLFLTGSMAKPDTFFIRDELPYHPTMDSTMGLRFVNLSQDKNKVTVNLLGEPTGSECPGLEYKQATAFGIYPVKKGAVSFVFEFRDAITGDLLETHTVNLEDLNSGIQIENQRRYRNFTLILFGKKGAAAPEQQQVKMMLNS